MQEQDDDRGAVIALAGRRIDAIDAKAARFPLQAVPLVRERVSDLLQREHAKALVSSAACGADLIALEQAERLNVRRRVVLPFAPERFRAISVVDRPGDWGSVFDRIILDAQTTGDLVVLNLSDGEEAYRATNEAILHEAQELCRADAQSAGCRQIAAVVWEGAARGDGDITEHFRRLATAAGFSERTIKAG